MSEKRKQYTREEREQRKATMGWNSTRQFYRSFDFPLWVIGKRVIVRGSDNGRAGVVTAVSEKADGGWCLNEFTYTVQYDDGTIEEGVYESQILAA